MSTPQPDGLSKLSHSTRQYALVGYFFNCFTRMETALDRAVEECSRLPFSLHKEATRHACLEAKAQFLSLYIGAASLNQHQSERFLRYAREAVYMQKLTGRLIRFRVHIMEGDADESEQPITESKLQLVEMNGLEIIRHAQRCDNLARRFLEVADVFRNRSSDADKIQLSALEIEQITEEITSSLASEKQQMDFKTTS